MSSTWLTSQFSRGFNNSFSVFLEMRCVSSDFYYFGLTGEGVLLSCPFKTRSTKHLLVPRWLQYICTFVYKCQWFRLSSPASWISGKKEKITFWLKFNKRCSFHWQTSCHCISQTPNRNRGCAVWAAGFINAVYVLPLELFDYTCEYTANLYG